MISFVMAAFTAMGRAAGGLLVYWLIGEAVELIPVRSELLAEIGRRIAGVEFR
jgi:hypothetical protein